MSFVSLKYVDEGGAIIQAQRSDGSLKIIEPTEPDLWQLAVAGDLGPVAAYVAPPRVISARDVDLERDRRIARFAYDGHVFQMDPASQQLVTAAGASAKFAGIAGLLSGNYRWADPDRDFAWWDEDNAFHLMDAQQMSDFADAAKKWVSDHRFTARQLKDLSPIPLDFDSDERWPS